MDDLMERGYTREQAARALVALTLPTVPPIDYGSIWTTVIVNAGAEHTASSALDYVAESSRCTCASSRSSCSRVTRAEQSRIA